MPPQPRHDEKAKEEERDIKWGMESGRRDGEERDSEGVEEEYVSAKAHARQLPAARGHSHAHPARRRGPAGLRATA